MTTTEVYVYHEDPQHCEVRVLTIDGERRGHGIFVLGPNDELFGKPSSQVLDGIYDDGGEFISSLDG